MIVNTILCFAFWPQNFQQELGFVQQRPTTPPWLLSGPQQLQQIDMECETTGSTGGQGETVSYEVLADFGHSYGNVVAGGHAKVHMGDIVKMIHIPQLHSSNLIP